MFNQVYGIPKCNMSTTRSNDGLAWVIIVVLTIAIIGTVIWAIWARHDLIHCQTNEHPACPTLYCRRTNDACIPERSALGKAGPAFRIDANGRTFCQGSTLPATVTDTDPLSRSAENWPYREPPAP